MKNQQRFAEIEFCLDKYFQTNLAPVMQHIQRDLSDKQIKEYADYKTSFAGVMSSLADASQIGVGLDSAQFHVKATGKWNSKTVEDYLEMCQKAFADDKTIQVDLAKLSSEWRTTVIREIGRERYDELSKQLGSDLAYAYVDYRVQQQMVQHMVNKETPKDAAEYIIKKAASGSLIGICNTLQESSLAREISDKAEKAYNPSLGEKVAARGVSFGMDVMTTGCVGSWGSVGKFAATEIVFDGIELAVDHLREENKTMTVEQCISQVVFDSEKNVFPEFRKQEKKVQEWENDYVQSVNNQLGKKMGILTSRPPIADIMEDPTRQYQMKPLSTQSETEKNQEDLRKKYNIPVMVAMGKEEEYLKSLEEQSKKKATQPESQTVQTTEQATTEQEPDQTNPQSQSTTSRKVQNPVQDNSAGWDNVINSLGFNGMGDIGHNLGYVISMLPDMLVGIFTGNFKSLAIKDNLLPFAAVLAGMFIKNPILKMLLIGMGGANLLNKGGHDALAKVNGQDAQRTSTLYRHYADQPLNPRICDVSLRGNILIATIDKVPCSVRLTQDIVNAYQAGALPLNTLANTILERNEQRQVVMDNNYERLQEQQRQQQVVLK